MQVPAGVDGSRFAVVTRSTDRVAGEVGAAVGNPPHVGHRVVERLQLGDAGGATRRPTSSAGSGGSSHCPTPAEDGDLVARSTAVDGAAGSPLTQIRHVSRTSVNAAP